MVCPQCNNENVSIEFVEKGSKTKKRGNGVLGHMNNAARATTATMTLGMSNLVWKKSKGNEKTTTKSAKLKTICSTLNTLISSIAL